MQWKVHGTLTLPRYLRALKYRLCGARHGIVTDARRTRNKTAKMKDSKIIEVNGIFLGAAIMLRDKAGWQVVAANARVAPADGQIAATFDAASAIVMRAYYGGAAEAA